MNGVQKVIKYFAMAFAIFLAVCIFGAIITVVTGVATGIAGVNYLTEDKDRINLSEQYSAEDIKNFGIKKIYVECDAEIVVKPGDALSVEAFNVTKDYEIRCNDGKICVIQDTPAINFVWNWFEVADAKEKVEITVPEDFAAEEVKINSGSGKVSVSGIDADRMLMYSGSGKVTMESIKSKYLHIDSGSGRVELIECYTEETKLETGSGSVTADEAVLGKLYLNSGSGGVRMRNVISQNAKFDSGSGSVSYTGQLTGACEFETGSGSLTLSLEGQEEEYLVKANCGSGAFRINGQRKEDGVFGENVKGELVIDAGSGSVNIEFNTPVKE